jgi:hypothetical protein
MGSSLLVVRGSDGSDGVPDSVSWRDRLYRRAHADALFVAQRTLTRSRERFPQWASG